MNHTLTLLTKSETRGLYWVRDLSLEEEEESTMQGIQDIPEIIVTRIQVGAIELEWKQDTKTGKVDVTVGGIFDNISDCRLKM